jgi:hypothetical protein
VKRLRHVGTRVCSTREAIRSRAPLAIAVLALLVAASGVSAVSAATHAVRLALFATNAGAVNGVKASKTPRPGRLVPLNSAGRFPRSVIPAVNAASINGIPASSTPTAGALLPLGPNASFPESAVPLDSTTKAPRIVARIYRTTDLLVPAGLGAGIDVSFDAVTFDTNHLYNPAFPTRLTAPVAGYYLIIADVGWETQNDLSNAGHSRTCELIMSSHGPLARAQQQPSVDTWLSMSTVVGFSAGDYVYLNCNHDNPTALAISHGSANDVWTTLSMLWVAPLL